MSTTSLARQRIQTLLDDNSFVEIGALITARATDFNLNQTETPSDGVITGYGVINGNLVYVYSQDTMVLNGSIGEMHAKKIVKLYDLAMKMQAPIIGMIDSCGLRLQEATDALNGVGEIYLKQSMASGVIPQITAVFGNCGGGLSLFPTLTDFTFMELTKGKLYVNAPNTIDGNNSSKINNQTVKFQSEKVGNIDKFGDEQNIIEQMRSLIQLLPASNEDEAEIVNCVDDLNRVCVNIEEQAGDAKRLLASVADQSEFFEIKENYGKEMVCGFLRLNGATIGAVANCTKEYNQENELITEYEPVLTVEGTEKAADFVNFCDAFHIPILTITNSKGFETTISGEKAIAKTTAKLIYAFSNATVPKVNVITEKAFGTAYIAMNSKALGCDLTFAWSNSEIGTMDASMAAKIICQGKSLEEIKQCTLDYKKNQNSVESAGKRGYVDQIIEPEETRKFIIGAFEMLFTKREDRPVKKHGTV